MNRLPLPRRARKGSVLATTLGLVAIFTTLSIGITAYFTDTAKRAREEAWDGVAEEAARTGLNYVMSWVEASLAKDGKLPREFSSVVPGDVFDPISAFASSPLNTGAQSVVPVPTLGSIVDTGDIGQLAGPNTREYVLGVMGNYRVSFKARVVRMRISNVAGGTDANLPDQYKIGVIGRVRANRRQGATQSFNLPLDNNESAGLVGERMITATIGREAFSKYAAIFDIDPIQNWAPGEGSEGPIHFNRGDYVDGQGLEAPTTIPAPAYHRTLLNLRFAGTEFKAVGAIKNPIFEDKVTMTAIPTTLTPRPRFTNAFNEDTSSYSTLIKLDNAAISTASAAKMAQVFQDPENQAQLFNRTVAGPKLIEHPIEFPRSVRQNLVSAVGAPVGAVMRTYANWFSNLNDGLYVFTRTDSQSTWGLPSNPGSGTAPGPVSGANLRPTGGIYIRGNVEIMRMTANANYSMYLFQLGYGGPAVSGTTSTSNPRRCYAVIADRTAGPTGLTVFAFSTATYPTLKSLVVDGGKDTIAEVLALAGSAPPNLSAFAAGANTTTTYKLTLNKPGPFPFNGVVFVDNSRYEPTRNLLDPAVPLNMQAYPNADYATPHPNRALESRTGNIYALGDIGVENTGASWPSQKRPLETFMHELFSTRSTTGAASGLTIMTTGNIFVQNHLVCREFPGATANPLVAEPTKNAGATQVTMATSRDILGLIADRQVLIGLAAPSKASRAAMGLRIDGAITALGDPARPTMYSTVANDEKCSSLVHSTGSTKAYNGSFMVEGVMRLVSQANPEEYFVVKGGPTSPYVPAPVGLDWDPGNPIYKDTAALGTAAYGTITTLSGNPNLPATGRGRLLLFGSLSVKKRGIVGVANRGYDKDYRYDKRLQNLAPPLYPASVNFVLRAVTPFAPVGLGYNGGPASNVELGFMSAATNDNL